MSLELNQIHHGDARALLPLISSDSIACSVWSPPYFVGKNYEQYLTYQTWVELLQVVIKQHFPIIKPGGFMVINIADILCFPDEQMPRIQAPNIRRHRSSVTREEILAAKAAGRTPALTRLVAYPERQ